MEAETQVIPMVGLADKNFTTDKVKKQWRKDEYNKFKKWRISYRHSNSQRDSNGYSTNAKIENSLGWTNNRLQTSEYGFSEIKRQINRKHKVKHRGKKEQKEQK